MTAARELRFAFTFDDFDAAVRLPARHRVLTRRSHASQPFPHNLHYVNCGGRGSSSGTGGWPPPPRD
jgi:hypothetical protein